MKKLALLLSLVLPVFIAPLDALSLNAHGQVAAGVGGTIVSVDRTPIAQPAGGAAFITDDRVGYQVCAPTCVLQAFDLRTGTFSLLSDRGANVFYAGGGVWAAWLDHVGVFSSTGFAVPAGGLQGVGPDGAIAYVANYQAGVGIDVRETNGTTWRLTDGGALDLQLLGNGRAIWRESLARVSVRGVPQPVQIGNAWRPRAIFAGGEWWVAYWNDHAGLVLHPFTSTRGYVVTTGDAFGYDIVALDNIHVRAAWALNQGETPDAIRLVDIDLTSPRTDLTRTPPPPPVDPPPAPPAPERQAPDRLSVLQQVATDHPEINRCDEASLDKGRAAIVDWTAQRLNKAEGRVVWGRKSRGRVVDGKADRPNTDGLTYLRSDGRFEIIDAMSGGGSCQPTWDHAGVFEQGQNGYWAPPQLPGEGITPPPPVDPRIAALERQVAALTEKLMAALAALDERQTRVNELEHERDNLTAQRDELQRQLDAAVAERDALRAANPCERVKVRVVPGWIGSFVGTRCEAVK